MPQLHDNQPQVPPSRKRPSSPTSRGSRKGEKRRTLAPLQINSPLLQTGSGPSLEFRDDLFLRPPIHSEGDVDVSLAPVPRGVSNQGPHAKTFVPPVTPEDDHQNSDQERGSNDDFFRRFREEGDEVSDSSSSSSDSENGNDEDAASRNPSSHHPNNLARTPLGEAIMFDSPESHDSDEDRDKAISMDLLSRGLATDPDMIRLENLRKADEPKNRHLWRGLQIVLARTTHPLNQPGLDPSVELQIDLSTMKHSFRRYVKAVVALPRLCSFYKDAQDAVAMVLREDRLIKTELEETSAIYRRNTRRALTLAMADARSDYIGHLNKISDQIKKQRNPLTLMITFLDNSLAFCDEHIMFWCLGVTFVRIRNAEQRDAKDKTCRAYEKFLSGVADIIVQGYLDSPVGGTFDWRAYIWNTYVEPLRKESLSRSPALRNTTWHQPTGRAFLNPANKDTDSRLLSKIDRTSADFRQVVADRVCENRETSRTAAGSLVGVRQH